MNSEVTNVSNTYHRSSASSDLVAMSKNQSDADAASGRPTVATLVSQINEALPDYPDYELQVSVKAGPDTIPLSQLNLSSCVPITTQIVPLIHSEMLKLS